MHIVMFYHSLLSDWNHGNAHFLRGVASELISRGYRVDIYEPRNAWSLKNLLKEHGSTPVDEFHKKYPLLKSIRYNPEKLNLDEALKDADFLLVHEWTEPDLVKSIGEHRARRGKYSLLFHDTHHRSITARKEMAKYDLSNYDGVLAFGQVVREIYLKNNWTRRAWTWHEAADTHLFRPISGAEKDGDLVWIGNWGDDERTAELDEFLFQPIKDLGLKAKVYGVRYPKNALKSLEKAGIEYGGWLPNYQVPEIFAKYKLTVHVPRRAYRTKLPGIPTIRPFEAMACGIPLVCAPWQDAENLFTEGRDYLAAKNGTEMKKQIAKLLDDEQFRSEMANHAVRTIRDRHTCVHRVDELLEIYDELATARRGRSATV
jgi:spore maturation protein CgeB